MTKMTKKTGVKKPAKKRPTPPREAKRRAVAKGVVAGKSTGKIAKDLGVSQRTVQKIVAEDSTQFLITKAMQPFTKDLQKLMPRVIQAVGDALQAEKGDTADHFTRLRAVERHGELLELAQGKPKEDESRGQMRLMTAETFFLLTATDAEED